MRDNDYVCTSSWASRGGISRQAKQDGPHGATGAPAARFGLRRAGVSTWWSRALMLACLSWTAAAAQPEVAQAAGSKVQTALGNLRWGMSEREVVRHVATQLKRRYQARLKATRGDAVRHDEVRQELRQAVHKFQRSLVEFDGQRTTWDASDLAGEFTHGNRESMMSMRDQDGSSHYFFIRGQLWKWVRVYDASVFGGKKFDRFQKVLAKKFGKGRVKNGERNPARGEQRWVEYLDRSSRLRAVDDTGFYGNYALVFEDMSTVRSLASLRTHRAPAAKRQDDVLAGIDGSGEETARGDVVDNITGKDRRRAGAVRQRRPSLFAKETSNESDAAYEARAKRAQDRAKAREERNRKRAKLRKQGQALNGVAGLDDNDPLSGI